jgi:hypothetical protein
MIKEKRDRSKSKYLDIMRYPNRLSGHLQCLWGLIKDGDLDKALCFVNVIQLKLSSAIITVYTQEEQKQFDDYIKLIEALASKNSKPLASCTTFSPSLVSLLRSFINYASKEVVKSEEPKILAQKVIMPWIHNFGARNEILEDQLDLLYSFLNKTLLQTGQL